ncbi:MAG: hypothetical protein CME19_03170 [Gemmatimonadetes bacterium]|nr:hypothetical protein [Gemmatimonadota bacterium]
MAHTALDIGNRKQFFLDHRRFDRSSGIRLRMGTPYQEPRPVLVADKPWEAQGIGAYNTVIREADGQFRLWYAAQMKSGLPQEGAVRLAYAESEDGIHWTKPKLGLVSFQGSTANNLVAPFDERQSMQGATVYIDKRAPADARYKLWSKYQPRDDEIEAGVTAGLWAMHSPDGLHWTYDDGQPNPPEQMCDTQNVFFWDDRIDAYVGYTRVHETQRRDEAAEMQFGKRYRSVGRITSPDFKTWSQPTLIVLEGDSLDLKAPLPPNSVDRPQLDFYTNAVYKHPDADDAYFMMPAAYHHWEADDSPATMDVQLLTSRDGISWNRVGDREPFLRRGFDGSPNGGMVTANVNPIHTETETWIYYSGRGNLHNAAARDGSNTGLFRAIMRRDGWICAEAGLSGGEFVTPPLEHADAEIELNVDCGSGGWLIVEIQDAEGRAVDGYTFKDCQTITANAIRARVSWKETGGRFSGEQPIRLRFVMRSCRLYSFRFVE